MLAVRQHRALRLLSQKGPQMFTAERRRAKPNDSSKLARAANGRDVLLDGERRDRGSAELADNTQRLTETSDQMMRAKDHAVEPSARAGNQ